MSIAKVIQEHLVPYGTIQKIFHLTLLEILSLLNIIGRTSITGRTANDRNTKEVQFSVPLKHLSNFWKALDMPLINCEVSWTLIWSKNCVIANETTQGAKPNANSPVLESRAPTGATF